MGIGWVFENPRTKRAFWMTFLLPFFGGFLYSRRWAAAFGMLLAIPFLLLLSALVAFFAVDSVFPLVSRDCWGGDFLECWGTPPLTAAELSHNQLVDLAIRGLWGLFVISWLVFFGLCAARQVREKPVATTIDAERVSKSVRTPVRAPGPTPALDPTCWHCGGSGMASPVYKCNNCSGTGTISG